MERAAVILCAGQGTRMRSDIAKVLHEIWGQPMALWPIKAAIQGGAEQVIAVVGHQAERVESTLKKHIPELAFALQAEQNGTGHAVQQAMPSLQNIEGTVLVVCGDTPCLTGSALKQLCEAREETNAPLALATAVVPDPTGYGRIVRDMLGRMRRIVEQKDATPDEREIDEINTGVYAFDAAFLRENLHRLEASNSQNEYYLTDLIELAFENLGDEESLPTLQIPFEEAMGVNNRLQLAEAAQLLRAQILHYWMQNGVTMIDPATTYIDASVDIGHDVILGANVALRGCTKIAPHVKVETGCVVFNSRLDSGAVLHPYTLCEEAIVGADANVGPFARLRPGAELKTEAKVGNFVEMKKAILGEKAKANHLSYIGDATVGAGSNIGAGTITCNYDGFGKNPTTLGENVFIGSNSTLVAPVAIESNAYVAAGSTINHGVPSGDLAIGRVRQENKKGYADKLRARFQRRKNKNG